MVRGRVLLAGVMALALTACGTTVPTPGGPDEDPELATATQGPVDPEALLVAAGPVIRSSEDADPELCVGGVLESLPPQCSGPVLAGAFAWDDVESRQEAGVRWTDERYYGVGHLDRDQGTHGTFTLTEPLSTSPPEGWTAPDPADLDFPQLCEDPTDDVPQIDQDARTADGAAQEEEQALLEVAQSLPGHVATYFSDGGPTMNVLVNKQGDLKDARGKLREVYKGPLCLAQEDLPSEEDLSAAQQALHETDLDILGSHGSGRTGELVVDVLVADQQTLDGIHDAVEEWLTPEQVRVSSTFTQIEDATRP